MSRGLAARRVALRALAAVEDDGAYSNLAVPRLVAELAEARDRSFASYLAYETLRWRGTIDAALARVLDRPLDAIEAPLLRVLRLGVLQLLRSDVPARAAISTSVDLARESVPAGRAEGAARFVNGVLRNVDRRSAEPLSASDVVEELALVTAHPRWQVEEIRTRFDLDEARLALEADNAAPGLTLRAVGDRDALVAELQAVGLAAEVGALAPEAVRVPGGDPRSLAAVAEGRAVPQDEASMLVAHATGAVPGDRVLDLCAGPGGKAVHLAQLVGGEGHVTAVELHPHRADLVRAAARTAQVDMTVIEGDARAVDVGSGYDVVLVDAPCSDLGTGRRRPEIRWRREPEDVAALAVLQQELFEAAIGRVRAGGHLTYAVCTWTRAETTAVVERFERDDRVELVAAVQHWPHRDGTDGMFHAGFTRR